MSSRRMSGGISKHTAATRRSNSHGTAASRIVYSHVVELGGSISAEHGIGQMKRDMLAELDSPARLAALRAIKAGLDPAGLFNPGKLIG